MTHLNPESSPTVGIVSLGCPKALVDSERIISQLRAQGYRIVVGDEGADLAIINTCGFIEDAIHESLDAIGDAIDHNGNVIVTGCLGADAEGIREAYPEVLAVTKAHAYEEVLSAVHKQLPPPHEPWSNLIPPAGLKLTPQHYAYIKISEGCNHKCSFCIIPQLRGKMVSRSVPDIMQEAENLVASGVKELLVIAQDSSAYGADLGFKTDFWGGRPVKSRLTDLAKSLGSLGAWVRLHYVYPYVHVDEIIPLMADGLILPYLDIPLQHASPRLLKAMRRPAATENTLARIQQWRTICPDITLRSSFIVGFPGETEEDFEQLLTFIEEVQLDRVGCFTYSPVEGAAANDIAEAIPEEVAFERQSRLMALQEEISEERLMTKIGQNMTVLIDGVNEDGLILARSPGDAPEIDGNVIIENAGDYKPGDFVEVEIINSTAHDLWAIPK